MQNVIHVNVRTYDLRRNGISNSVLRCLAQWEPFETAVRRASLLWLGHVARMSVDKPQKQTFFGWIADAKGKERCPFKQAQWINSCLRQAGIPELEWFRLAQDRELWRKTVLTAFPLSQLIPTRKGSSTQAWQVGDPLPHWARPALNAPPEREYAHSEEELGDQTRGDALEPEPGSYGRERRPLATDVKTIPPGLRLAPFVHCPFQRPTSWPSTMKPNMQSVTHS